MEKKRCPEQGKMWCKSTKGLRLKEKRGRRRKKLGGEKGKKMENKKIAISIVLAAIAMALMLVAPAAASNTVYFVPQSSEASYGNTTTVKIYLNTENATQGGQINLTYDSSSANVTNVVFGSDWEGGAEETWDSSIDGREWITFKAPSLLSTGEAHLICTLTIECVNASYCQTPLNLIDYNELPNAAKCSELFDDQGQGFVSDLGWSIDWQDGTFTCKNIPDLVVTDVSPQVVDPAAGTYTVTYTVKNVGNAAAGPFWVNLTVDGTQNATEYVSGGLAAGASYTGNFSGYIETVSGDSDTVMVCADYNNTVDEKTYEDNNCMSKEVTKARTVDIGNYTIRPNDAVTVPITVRDMAKYGTVRLRVTFDNTKVNATHVAGSSQSTITASVIDNANQFVNISAWNAAGTSETPTDIVLAYVTFEAGSSEGYSPLNLEVFELKDIDYNVINPNPVNGSITISVPDTAAPVVTIVSQSRAKILNTNGRARPSDDNGLYNESLITVSVTDDHELANVTIDLSSLGTGIVSMVHDVGDNYNYTVRATTKGINLTHGLVINATDEYGNSNTSVCFELEVLRRGDVVRDNSVDMGDALYIARWLIGLETSAPDPFVADVVGEGGAADDLDGVNMGDALYIARYTVGLEGAP